jgi:hypothetical protein
MPILGAQGSTKGPSTAPTIGTATSPTSTTASVTFTAPSFSKLPITSYTVTSSPGGLTGTGSSSPITVTGLSAGTAYTFTVTASHANGQSAASSSSNSVTPVSVYALSQTFNSSGTYTVPSGITKLAVFGWGGGGGGSIGGSAADGHGGSGGAGGGGVAFSDLTVTPGQVYTITVGTGGTTNANYLNSYPTIGNDTSFISPNSVSLLVAGGGNQGFSKENPAPGNTRTGGSNVSGAIFANTGQGGARGLGANSTNNITRNANAGSTGTAPTALSLTLDGTTVSYTFGGGGGGGGGGAAVLTNAASGSSSGGGGGGSTTNGGSGGSGGNAGKSSLNSGSANAGNAANSGSQPAGGGAGGGGRGVTFYQDGNYIEPNAGAGGNGGAGRVYIYGK